MAMHSHSHSYVPRIASKGLFIVRKTLFQFLYVDVFDDRLGTQLLDFDYPGFLGPPFSF